MNVIHAYSSNIGLGLNGGAKSMRMKRFPDAAVPCTDPNGRMNQTECIQPDKLIKIAKRRITQSNTMIEWRK